MSQVIIFPWKMGLFLPYSCLVYSPEAEGEKKKEVKFHFFLVAHLLLFYYEVLFTLFLWALGGIFSGLEVQAIL